LTKRLASLALIGAAAATFVLPATSASAACGTFTPVCPDVAVAQICHTYGTYEICVP
jgi:hypothetical protein